MDIEKPPRKKLKGEKTKRKLFKSAETLFRKDGVENVSVDAIVAAAGVSKGTFYVYFESKDALIAAYMSDYIASVDGDYASHIASLPEDISSADMLFSLIEKIADVLSHVICSDRMRLVYRILLSGSDNANGVKDYNRALYAIFSNVLGRGIDRGEFCTHLPLDVLTKHFVLAMRGITYEWCIREPEFDLTQQSLAHFQILIRGIQAAK